MKLNKLKGIANNLCSHLITQIIFGCFKEIPSKIDKNILEESDELSEHCLDFIKENINQPFDFNRIKSINLKISKSSDNVKIAVVIKVGDKEITGNGFSFF